MEGIEIHGFCDPRFKAVKDVFVQNFKNNWETGASVAVTEKGKFVVDLWAGYANEAKTRPWEKDTIVNTYSTTKIMAVLCGLILVDREKLDFDAPVSKYWPEFAQNGKENMPVRYIFSHMSGLAGIEEVITAEDYYDWDKIVKLLAAQKPWWEPGTKAGYHASTHGYLIGELVRRITGKTLGTFFREEITGPLKADFHIGLSKKHESRIADLVSEPSAPGSNISLFKWISGLANKSKLLNEEIGDWEKSFQINSGGEDVCYIKIQDGKLDFESGKTDKPSGVFKTPKNKSNMIFLLYPHHCETPEFVKENLQFEGEEEDLEKLKKIFRLIIYDARKYTNPGTKMYLNAVSLRRRTSDWEWRSAEMPAVNGHGNARSAAKISSIISNKGIMDGIRFLKPETVELVMEEQFKGIDLINNALERWGLGLGLKSDRRRFPNENVAHWGGTGGSRVVMDLDLEMCVAYVMNRMRNQTPEETKKNRMTSDTRGNGLIEAVYRSYGLI